MNKKTISSWIRQARYRANKRNIYSDLQISDVQEIVESFDGRCAYCGKTTNCQKSEADTLDHPFPLSDDTPNIPANVLPICKKMRGIKKNHDLAWLFATGAIERDTYLRLVKFILSRRGGDTMKKHIKTITGIQDE